MYGTGFTARFLVRIRARDGTWGLGIVVDSFMELTEIGDGRG